jgi:hypothetical protein
LGKPSRPILQADGTLQVVNGEPIKQWKIKRVPGDEEIWKALYHNSVRKNKKPDCKKKVNFNMLFQQFSYKKAVEAGSKTQPAWWKSYYPPRDFPLMPMNVNDWHRDTDLVDKGDLY